MKKIVSHCWRKLRCEQGQALILVALAMIGMVGVMGLAVDVGIIMAVRRDMVKLVDSAALAAAGALSGLPSESDELRQARAVVRAREYALLNGHDPDADPGWYVSFPEWPRKLVEVNASRIVPLAFLRALSINEVTVNASTDGRQAEAPPIDIVLVQDVSASQCYDNYYPDLLCGQLLKDPPPDYNPRALQPYKPALATTGNEWCYSYATGWRLCCHDGSDWDICTGGEVSQVNVPWMPFAMQQDAARFFVDQLDPRYDQIAVVSFSSNVDDDDILYEWLSYEDNGARMHIGLTADYASVKDAIGYSPRSIWDAGDQGLFPSGRTNMARGIDVGLSVLTTYPPARQNAIGAMILLGDGSPTVRLDNTNPSGCNSSNPGACTDPRADTMALAQVAADNSVIIYTIFVGSESFAQNHSLILQYIADLTDNRRLDGDYSGSRALPSGYGPAFTAEELEDVTDNFYLASDQAQLEAAYESIYRKIYTRLVQ